MEQQYKAKGNYLLISTDGFSLDDYTFYETNEEASEAMKKAYSEAVPEQWDENDKEMSRCGERDAILFTSECVYVWNIISIFNMKN